MRSILTFFCGTTVCAGAALADATPASTDAIISRALTPRPVGPFPTKSPAPPQRTSPEGGSRAGGDTPATATPITALPFTDSGNNAANTNFIGEICPDTIAGGGGGLDQWYVFLTGGATTTICVTTCDLLTDYDTMIYAYEEAVIPGSWHACEDDTCSAGLGSPYVAETTFAVQPFTTYLIAVDAWSAGDVGNFCLGVSSNDCLEEICTETPPCVIECCAPDIVNPGGCVLGGDGDDGCFAPGQDEFFPIECGDTVCGEFFTDSSQGLRDLDWYEFILETTCDVTMSFVTENQDGGQVFLSSLDDGCDPIPPELLEIHVATGCEVVTAVLNYMKPGRYAFVVAPFSTDGSIDCPNSQAYQLSLACDCTPCPGDGNGDGVVDFDDLNLLLSNWGAPCQ